MSELAKIESFRREIALVETWEDIKISETKGIALAIIAKRMNIAIDGQNELGRTRVDLEKKKGAKLDEFFPQGGINQYNKEGKHDEPSKMPVSKNESSNARLINKEPDFVNDIMDEIEKNKDIITPSKVSSGIRKRKREEEIEKQKEKIEQSEFVGLYDIIVIDPPWKYNRNYDPETSRIASPYPEMDLEELKKIDLPANENCILWLWTTHAFIFDAKKLMDIWGFDYKAILTWDKDKMGMGYWLRMQCEFCLLGIKGSPVWDIKNIRDIIREPRREHSRKPKGFYEKISDNFVGKKADYFSREEIPGFDRKGNDINKFQ